FQTTYATGVSPQRSDGTPTTATSATAGWAASTLSTSAGYTFSPPVMIMSLTRSLMNRYPSSSSDPTSPVRKKPLAVNDSAVASGRRQYPAVTLGPRTTISPDSPGGS